MSLLVAIVVHGAIVAGGTLVAGTAGTVAALVAVVAVEARLARARALTRPTPPETSHARR